MKDDSNYVNNIKNVESRRTPQSHPAVDPPICKECESRGLLFFDPTCVTCQDILLDPGTSISEIFAIIRQWVPQTQQNIDILIEEVLRRGAHIDDKDGLTDMNLLHYAAKSGTYGVGDISTSCRVVKMLIDEGINVMTKCKWTNMTALHYAVFFDISEIVEILLECSKGQDIDYQCNEFDNGTALHIACSNGAYKSIPLLLKYGANPHVTNKCGKVPLECLPKNVNEDATDFNEFKKTKVAIEEAMKKVKPKAKQNLNLATLQALGLDLNDQVVVAGKLGVLRYCGSTDFASGQWAGIELNEPVGKNDGSVNGIRYFKCRPKYGMFSPLTRVKKYDGISQIYWTPDSTLSSPNDSRSSSVLSPSTKIKLGDRVLVAGQKPGVVKYLGPTKFANGTWVGVELEDMAGKNDGTVAGVRYFQCKPKHGVFAPLGKVERVDEETEESLEDEELLRQKKESSSPIETRVMINRHIEATNNLSVPKKVVKPDITLGAQINFTLKTGMSVYVNNEVGIVRYIGRVHFAEDVWLGIELRKPNGKNDGVVEGKKYFSCKPKFGLMVRAHRATCRGINCSQLIDLKFR